MFNLVRLVKHRGAERNNGEGAVPGSIAARGTTPSPLTGISRDRNQSLTGTSRDSPAPQPGRHPCLRGEPVSRSAGPHYWSALYPSTLVL